MSFEFLQGVELGKDFGVRYYKLGSELERLEVECKKLRLANLASEARGFACHHNIYLSDLEDILRDRQVLMDKGWTLQDFASRVNDIFQDMKDLKSDCRRLHAQVLEKKNLRRRKRQAKSSLTENVELSTSSSPSPSPDTVE
jgi:hypothetical protein